MGITYSPSDLGDGCKKCEIENTPGRVQFPCLTLKTRKASESVIRGVDSRKLQVAET